MAGGYEFALLVYHERVRDFEAVLYRRGIRKAVLRGSRRGHMEDTLEILNDLGDRGWGIAGYNCEGVHLTTTGFKHHFWLQRRAAACGIFDDEAREEAITE